MVGTVSEVRSNKTTTCVTDGSSGWTVDLFYVQIIARGNSGATGMIQEIPCYTIREGVCLCV